MNGTTLEIELKLAADDDRPLRRLARVASLGPAELGRPRRVTETDRYLDTADGRLRAAGWACRLRTRAGDTIVSLKGPAVHRAGDALHRRPEAEGPARRGRTPDPASWQASAARDRLLHLSAGAPLVEVVRLRQSRTERLVRVDGRAVGELSLDRCRILHGGREVGRLRVVELELSAGAVRARRPLIAALGAVPGLRPDPASKLEHALALLEGRP